MTTERFDTAMIFVFALRELVKKTDFSTPVRKNLTAVINQAYEKFPLMEVDNELVRFAEESIQESPTALYDIHGYIDTALAELEE